MPYTEQWYEIEIDIVYRDRATTEQYTSKMLPWAEDGVLYVQAGNKRIAYPLVHVHRFTSVFCHN